MKPLSLSIFVTMVTAAALPVLNTPIDETTLPGDIFPTLHEGEHERVNRTCDIGTCYQGYCYVDEDIPWDDEDKPNNSNSDNKSDNDKIFAEMMRDIHHWAHAKTSTAKREPQSDEEFEEALHPCDDDQDGHPGQLCDSGGSCAWSILPGMAKRGAQCKTNTDCSLFPYDVCDAGQCVLSDSLPNRPEMRDVPAFCNIPSQCTSFGPIPPPEQHDTEDTNKDVNCHNDEQCSSGICQDGICLPNRLGL